MALGNLDSGIGEMFSCAIWNPGLWNPEYNARNRESPLEIGIQNPSSTRKRLESSTWNPESKTLLDYLTRGDKEPFGEGITLN